MAQIEQRGNEEGGCDDGCNTRAIMAKAFERGPASLLAPFNYLQLVGATVIGFGLYGDLPDNITWIGAAAIVAAGLYIAWRERRER